MVWALLACAPSDSTRFLQATQANALTEGHTACAGIGDPTLRGECAAHVVREHGAEDPARADQTCALGESSWADECRFLLAEALHDPQDPRATAERCLVAGRYTTSCLMHVWSGHAGDLKRTHPMPRATAIYAESLAWAGSATSDDLTRRAWSLFYRTELDLSATLDPQDCASLDATHSRACRAGLQEAIARTIHRVAREQPGAFQAACGATPEVRQSVVAEATGLTYVSSTAMDAVVRRAVAADCRLERMGDGSEE